MKNYSAIILAAGYSSRMGSFKPLMDLMGKTPLQRGIDLFKNSGLNNIIVVTGYLNERIEQSIKDDIKIIQNHRFDNGMFSSVKTGVQSLPEETEAFFILPVDIPSVKEHTIKKMIESYEESNEGIVFPVFNEEKGHPVLISYCYAEEIIRSDPKGGLRDILNQHIDEWCLTQVADRGILLDMDTKEEFKILLDHVSAFPYPDYQECMEILRLSKVDQDAVNHMKSTAELSRKISVLLNERGVNLNTNLIYSGALLHDAGKGKKEHAVEGAVIAESLGYECLSEVISEHMELEINNDLGEKEIVFLCDKLMKGTTLVTLEERFADAFDKFADMPDVLKHVNKKYNDAKMIKESIEKILGVSLETLR